MKPWVALPHFLSAAKCDEQLSTLRSSTEMGSAKVQSEKTLDKTVRRSNVGWPSLESNAPLFNKLSNTIYLANLNVWKFKLGGKIEWQLTYYTSEDSGVYHPHTDCQFHEAYEEERKLSMTLQLSDSAAYRGGNFQFESVSQPDKWPLRQKGTLLLFPSFLAHGVTQLTEGERWSLVAWFSGPALV